MHIRRIISCLTNRTPVDSLLPTGLPSRTLPRPFLLSYSVFVFSLFFRFYAVLYIRLAISSAFERTYIYCIVSYRVNVARKTGQELGGGLSLLSRPRTALDDRAFAVVAPRVSNSSPGCRRHLCTVVGDCHATLRHVYSVSRLIHEAELWSSVTCLPSDNRARRMALWRHCFGHVLSCCEVV